MADDLKARFKQASVDVKALTQRPSDSDMLALYALYKQATEGDASGDKPGFFDFVARAKFEAWESLKGTAPKEAMQRYIDKVRALGA
jgi:diazepam-binding inhibitor (GABA receptor modulator, acyl-CoA-binding protein)